jgi:hypothetical protein
MFSGKASPLSLLIDLYKAQRRNTRVAMTGARLEWLEEEPACQLINAGLMLFLKSSCLSGACYCGYLTEEGRNVDIGRVEER